MTDIKEKITNLKKNAAFQMSLSGKELFHSNMIAMFLTQVDDNKQPTDLAKTMINLFPPNTMTEYKENPDDITVFDVLREYKNFDLLICYCTKKVKKELEDKKICCVSDISDLDEHGNEEVDSLIGVDRDTDVIELLKSMHYVIIENKFKSFPYKEQLDKYSQKVIDGMEIVSFKKKGSNRNTYIKTIFDEKKNVANTTCYLLAPNGSLQAFYNNSDNLFGNSKKILWSGIPYETYYEKLQPFENKQSKELMSQFIYEYRMFLETMINLYEECVEKRIKKNCFISSEHNKYLLQGRIQDFYEKIIYNRVLTKLRTDEIINPNTETKSLENPKNGEWPFFSSNAYYSNQTGYLDFRYVWENSDINAGIQIQGSSFRIVFCHEKDFLKKVYGLSSFKGKKVADYFEKRDKNRNKRDTLEEFSKEDEIKDTKACIKYIYGKINGELSNSDTDIKLPELHFSKGSKETIYSYSVSDEYIFRYGNCDLNEISPENDYRELDYEKFKKLIKAALIVIKQQCCYEELKNLPEVKKIKASL